MLIYLLIPAAIAIVVVTYKLVRLAKELFDPVVPFPSNATGTTLGLIDAATGSGTWKLS